MQAQQEVGAAKSTRKNRTRPQPAVFSVADGAHYAGISERQAYRLSKAGTFPPIRQLSPARVGYLRSELDAWLASRPVADVCVGVQYDARDGIETR